MNVIKDKLPGLVQEELQAANELHPAFHSRHEGFAVLHEEIDEAKIHMDQMVALMWTMWDGVKDDHCLSLHEMAHEIEHQAVNLAAEAVQVAAMAQKFLDFLEVQQ